MKRQLIVFTHKYPYEPPIEQFFDSEIEYLAQTFEVIVVPLSRNIDINKRYDSFPDSVRTILIKRKNKILEVLIGICLLFLHQGFFWWDLCNKNKNKNDSLIKTFFYLIKEYVKTFSLFCSVYKTLKRENFQSDSILYSYWFGSSFALACLLKRKAMFKEAICVSRAHGMGDLYVQNGCGRKLFAYHLYKKYSNCVFSISANGLKHLESYGLKNVAISRLGTNLLDFSSDCSDKISDKNIIVSCSVINQNKRIVEMAKILNSIDDIDIEWHHFGDGVLKEDVLNWLKRNANKNFSFVFHGFCENEEVLKFYIDNNPKLFINLSKVEGIPVSIMEAMSCSIPCLATNVGATSEIVEDNFNGFLVNEDLDFERIANTIKTYISSSKNNQKNKRCNAFQTWLEKYNASSNFSRFSSQLNNLKNK